MADTTTRALGKPRMLTSAMQRRRRKSAAMPPRRFTPMQMLRMSRLMTQTQFAAIVGVSRPTIARFERGKDVPSPDLRARIACILGTMPECLWPPGEVLDRLLAS